MRPTHQPPGCKPCPWCGRTDGLRIEDRVDIAAGRQAWCPRPLRRCYNDPAIRAQHPPQQVSRAPGREPSAQELDRMIAEQRAALPLWWDAETQKLTRGHE